MLNQWISVKMTAENTASFSIPFEWEQGAASHLMIHVNMLQEVWLQYQIIDANQEVRAQFVSGKTIQPVVVSHTSQSTSPNTISGPLPKGDWTLQVQVAGKEIAHTEVATIKLIETNEASKAEYGVSWTKDNGQFLLEQFPWSKASEQTKRWYKGDFHTHTIASDGQMTREENLISAKAQGLDFFVATDHNLVPTSWCASEQIRVIPGIEITAKAGHFNILGAKEYPFVDFDVAAMETEGGMNAILNKSREAGSLNSINHPFLTIWKWLFKDTPLELIDTFEIWNDPTYIDNAQATEHALEAWDLLTNDGWRLTGIGGSDSHLRPEDHYPESEQPSLIGDPGTFVWSESNSAEALLRNVKKGHVFVTRENLQIDFDAEGQRAGSQLTTAVGIARVTLDSDEPLVIQWVEKGEVIRESSGIKDTFEFQWDEHTYSWLRLTIRKQDGTLVGFTNPVYFGERTPSLHTWGDVLERLG
ncbi:CehA/McbA family metallohydrolase [Alkalicoccobacillus porphyridii]|uniref:Polymerase/histidinol phosphatase N-terminal domain-containing protein n=1 Tax=Alkalicoccobacillus porphyridii TaxID=2597270 RepID=A0A554A144_9BACI|nr:CehA/McbA family metallohydrolase [Alkalicoccobacillus porphyridii]TSB47414.1 hypothetical protein FN960_06675 [Alkalicoccobacillus porphyridii]